MHQALRQSNLSIRVVSIVLLVLVGNVAHAATGTIDSVNKYAWGSVGGWTNFASTNGNITVTNTALTGYAWSANDGWLSLAPTNGGVYNDGAGTLSGFAWDESNGWINFQGVTIDSSGVFHGEAIGVAASGANNVINFDCTNCKVVTTWRPTSSTSSGSPSGVHGQGSGSVVTTTATTPANSPSSPVYPAEPPAGEKTPGVYPNGAGTSGGSGGSIGQSIKGLISLVPSWMLPHPPAPITTKHKIPVATTTPAHHISLRTIIAVVGVIAVFFLLVLAAVFFL